MMIHNAKDLPLSVGLQNLLKSYVHAQQVWASSRFAASSADKMVLTALQSPSDATVKLLLEPMPSELWPCAGQLLKNKKAPRTRLIVIQWAWRVNVNIAKHSEELIFCIQNGHTCGQSPKQHVFGTNFQMPRLPHIVRCRHDAPETARGHNSFADERLDMVWNYIEHLNVFLV